VQNALQKDRSNLRANELMARIFNDIGQARQVSKQLEPFKDELTSALRLELAKAYARQNKFHSAKEALGDNSDLYSQAADKLSYYMQLSEANLALRDADAAEAAIQAAEKLNLSDQSMAEIPLQRAKQALVLQQDFAAASKHLEQALALNPGLAEAFALKGRIAINQNQFEQAEDYLTQALINLPQTDIITPQRVNVLEALIRVLSQQGRSSEALVYSKLLADASPRAEELKRKFEDAVELYQKGDLDQAEEILLELYSTGANPDVAGRLLGMINYQRGDMARAQEYLSTHLDPETASSPAVQLLAETQLRLNQLDEALVALRTKLRDDPDNLDLLALYGLTAMSLNEREEGVQAIRKVLAADPKRTKLYVALAAQLVQRQPQEALKVLRAGYRHNPQDFDIQNALVQFYVRNNQVDEALKIADQILKTPKPTDKQLALVGSVYMRANDTATAKKYFQGALKQEPTNQVALLATAGLLMIENKPEQAAKAYQAIYQEFTANASAYKGYLLAMNRINKLAEGIKELEAMSDDHINNPAPLIAMAEAALGTNDPAKAIEYAQRAFTRSPTAQETKVTVKRVFEAVISNALRSNDVNLARTAMMEAIQIDPESQTLLSMLAELEINQGNNREAEKLIDQIESQFNNKALALALKGHMLERQGKDSEALASYQESWQLVPQENVARRIFLGLNKAGNTQQAERFLDDWGVKLPNSVGPQEMRALSMHEKNDTPKAISMYENILKQSPTNALVLNNLAWLYQESKDKRALETARRAFELNSQNPMIMDTYGWILVNNGQREEGLKLLERAAQLAPENADIGSHLRKARTMK
jgi:tetratricopeptide (TPR) repeat protein